VPRRILAQRLSVGGSAYAYTSDKPRITAHDDNAEESHGNEGATMLLLRRHPRFVVFLSFLLTASLLLLLPHSPFPTFQPTSYPRKQPFESPLDFHGLSARVRRAERTYQKMIIGRDALIAKVGPTPRDVALSVLSFSSYFN